MESFQNAVSWYPNYGIRCFSIIRKMKKVAIMDDIETKGIHIPSLRLRLIAKIANQL